MTTTITRPKPGEKPTFDQWFYYVYAPGRNHMGIEYRAAKAGWEAAAKQEASA